MNPVRASRFYYVYVLQSAKSRLWHTGFAVDLRKRFSEHNEDTRGWTKGKGPFDIIYYEACRNITDTRLREKYLKTGMGKRYIKSRLKRFLALTG